MDCLEKLIGAPFLSQRTYTYVHNPWLLGTIRDIIENTGLTITGS